MSVVSQLRGKRVFLTGHTGFKGAWLTSLLGSVGAEVYGYSLDPRPESQMLFEATKSSLKGDERGDIRSVAHVREAVQRVQPDFVFHLAAQPLVLASYQNPIETFETNVMGTANLLESVRLDAPDAVTIIVTTDKVYQNEELGRDFIETDALGGRDPYAVSKACAEHVTHSYRKSFFDSESRLGRVATVRGGNVIGGGDFAENRLVPDIVRSISAGQPVEVRNPNSVRPWQHVLDCLWGYLATATWLDSHAGANSEIRSFNFGPSSGAHRTVAELVDAALGHWQGELVNSGNEGQPHEAGTLRLSIELAKTVLNWVPVWSFQKTVEETMSWYRLATQDPNSAALLVEAQVKEFLTDVQSQNQS